MKWIKTYENFVNDDNRGEDTRYPELNPVVKMNATEYVDSKMKTDEKFELFRVVGINPKQDLSPEEFDKMFDEVREKAIQYYTKNPEEMGKPVNVKKFSVPGTRPSDASGSATNIQTANSDGISRTNNIGGTSFTNSPRVGESKSNFDTEIKISDDDMLKFSQEEPLRKLIADGKIGLGDKIVKVNKKDDKTIKTLDIYLEIDKDSLKSDSED